MSCSLSFSMGCIKGSPGTDTLALMHVSEPPLHIKLNRLDDMARPTAGQEKPISIFSVGEMQHLHGTEVDKVIMSRRRARSE